MEQFTPYILQICGILITMAIGFASMKFSKATGIQIEQGHRDALHNALMSGIKAAVQKDAKAGVEAAVSAAITHAKKSSPDAIAALKPSPEVLANIAMRYAIDSIAPAKTAAKRAAK